MPYPPPASRYQSLQQLHSIQDKVATIERWLSGAEWRQNHNQYRSQPYHSHKSSEKNRPQSAVLARKNNLSYAKQSTRKDRPHQIGFLSELVTPEYHPISPNNGQSNWAAHNDQFLRNTTSQPNIKWQQQQPKIKHYNQQQPITPQTSKLSQKPMKRYIKTQCQSTNISKQIAPLPQPRKQQLNINIEDEFFQKLKIWPEPDEVEEGVVQGKQGNRMSRDSATSKNSKPGSTFQGLNRTTKTILTTAEAKGLSRVRPVSSSADNRKSKAQQINLGQPTGNYNIEVFNVPQFEDGSTAFTKLKPSKNQQWLKLITKNKEAQRQSNLKRVKNNQRYDRYVRKNGEVIDERATQISKQKSGAREENLGVTENELHIQQSNNEKVKGINRVSSEEFIMEHQPKSQNALLNSNTSTKLMQNQHFRAQIKSQDVYHDKAIKSRVDAERTYQSNPKQPKKYQAMSSKSIKLQDPVGDGILSSNSIPDIHSECLLHLHPHPFANPPSLGWNLHQEPSHVPFGLIANDRPIKQGRSIQHKPTKTRATKQEASSDGSKDISNNGKNKYIGLNVNLHVTNHNNFILPSSSGAKSQTNLFKSPPTSVTRKGWKYVKI